MVSPSISGPSISGDVRRVPVIEYPAKRLDLSIAVVGCRIVGRGGCWCVENVLHLFAQLVLSFDKFVHTVFEVLTHDTLQAVAVKSNQIGEKLVAEHRCAGPGFALADYLQQHMVSHIGSVLCIDNGELLTIGDHLPYFLECHIAALLRVVEPSVLILFDGSQARVP